MMLGGVTVVAGAIFQPIGQLLAYLLGPLLAYTIAVVEWAASLPGGVFVTGQVGVLSVLLYYVILFRIVFCPYSLQWKSPVGKAWNAGCRLPGGVCSLANGSEPARWETAPLSL